MSHLASTTSNLPVATEQKCYAPLNTAQAEEHGDDDSSGVLKPLTHQSYAARAIEGPKCVRSTSDQVLDLVIDMYLAMVPMAVLVFAFLGFAASGNALDAYEQTLINTARLVCNVFPYIRLYFADHSTRLRLRTPTSLHWFSVAQYRSFCPGAWRRALNALAFRISVEASL
jgi:hypothetical protein